MTAACAASLVTWPKLHAAAVPRKPNIIVLLCDDLGYGDLACFGHPTIKTPNLDKLAADGMRLTDCYASAPVCSPSRCGMITGRTPTRERIDDWIPDRSGISLRRSAPSIARSLKSAGYATLHAGKWHLNSRMDGADPTPGDLGFDRWLATQNNAAPSHLNPRNFIRDGKPVGQMQGHSCSIIIEEAFAFLRDTQSAPGGRPFFMNLWFHTSHEPVATSDPFVKMYPDAIPQRAIYHGNVTQMDHEVGRLMHALRELRLLDDTLIFFTSDNGPETLNRYQGSARSYGSAGPLRGMKLQLWEGGIRVPGILHWPSRIKPAQIVSHPVSNVDALPTFCALAGVEAPADRPLDGASIVPVFDGGPIQRKSPLYWRYDKAFKQSPSLAMRDGEWKVLADKSMTKLELYNLARDPGEKRDLSAKEPDVLKSMVEKLKTIDAQVRRDRDSLP